MELSHELGIFAFYALSVHCILFTIKSLQTLCYSSDELILYLSYESSTAK
nr:MAG TPA: hypothetical protein [Bacteriophage sp.]